MGWGLGGEEAREIMNNKVAEGAAPARSCAIQRLAYSLPANRT